MTGFQVQRRAVKTDKTNYRVKHPYRPPSRLKLKRKTPLQRRRIMWMT